MIKTLGLKVLVGTAWSWAAPGAMAAGNALPEPAACVWYDQVVCTYSMVDDSTLADGRMLELRPVPGFSTPDRIEIKRQDDNHLLVFFYYPSRADLQGVAQ